MSVTPAVTALPADDEPRPPKRQIEAQERNPWDLAVRGDTGPAVREIQQALIAHGMLAPGSADGDFGENTENAVKSFQRAKGLSPDGQVGPNTWVELRKTPTPTGPKRQIETQESACGEGDESPIAKRGVVKIPNASVFTIDQGPGCGQRASTANQYDSVDVLAERAEFFRVQLQPGGPELWMAKGDIALTPSFDAPGSLGVPNVCTSIEVGAGIQQSISSCGVSGGTLETTGVSVGLGVQAGFGVSFSNGTARQQEGLAFCIQRSVSVLVGAAAAVCHGIESPSTTSSVLRPTGIWTVYLGMRIGVGGGLLFGLVETEFRPGQQGPVLRCDPTTNFVDQCPGSFDRRSPGVQSFSSAIDGRGAFWSEAISSANANDSSLALELRSQCYALLAILNLQADAEDWKQNELFLNTCVDRNRSSLSQ